MLQNQEVGHVGFEARIRGKQVGLQPLSHEISLAKIEQLVVCEWKLGS